MSEVYSHNALPPGTLVQEYRVVRVLGIGSFGIVYAAENKFFEEVVAIKEFLPADLACRKEGTVVVPLSSETEETYRWALEKFLEEAKTLWELGRPAPHRNIVRVKQFIEANDTAYMVMDYEEGQPLSQILEERGTLPEDELKEILEPLLDGLERVHEASVWHRDIKPSNILIRSDGSPVLIDFGAAHREVAGAARSVMAVFSPAYAAPEQVYGAGPQGPWTDIYALGATLYRAVTGEVPTNAAERVQGTACAPAARVAEGRYTPALLAAVDAALELKSQDRPQSIGAWRRLFETEPALSAAEDSEATVVRPGHPKPPSASAFPSEALEFPARPEETPPSAEALGPIAAPGPRRRPRRVAFAVAVVVAAAVGLAVYRYWPEIFGPPASTIEQNGALTVALMPPEIIGQGAKWRVDGGDWQTGDAKTVKLAPGMHTLEFIDLAGWIPPNEQAIEITHEATTAFTARYVKQPLAEAVLRSAQARNNELGKTLKGRRDPLPQSAVKGIFALKTGFRASLEVKPEFQSAVNNFLDDTDLATRVTNGDCDLLLHLKIEDGQTLLIARSNLFGQVQPERVTVENRGQLLASLAALIRRDYCSNVLQALYLLNPNNDDDFAIEIRGETDGRLQVGERIQICVPTGRMADCLLLNVNLDGIYALLPPPGARQNRPDVQGALCSQDIEVSPPTGNELLLALGAIDRELLSSYRYSAKPDQAFARWSYDAAGPDNALDLCERLLTGLSNTAFDKWSAESLSIRTYE
ncbi:MAG: protein kinase [Desulfobacterales bacterium]|nr:MAG: protein kinase [Desulfobacterales bacterium]